MLTSRWLSLLPVLVVLSAGDSPAFAQKVKVVKGVETVDRRHPERLFKTPAFAPLREPDRIEVLPVRIIGQGLSSTYRVVEKPVAVDAQAMGKLRKTLLDTDSYGGFTACMFDPGVAFRFYKGTQSVQAVFCFMCGEVIFEDASGRNLSDRMWFAAARTEVLAAARKAFPKDQALRELPY
jgi:hypothetical protein